MQADILDAVATKLADEMSVPVYYPSLPRSLVEAPPRTRMIVITPGGSVLSGGDNSHLQITRARADLRCYGENDYQAMRVYREAAEILKGLKPQIINVGPDGEEVGVKLYNATLSNGPIALTDPDTHDAVVHGTWGVIGHESEVGAATTMTVNQPTIVKTVDESNDTDAFTNDDELKFDVEAGQLWYARYTLMMTSDDVPHDVQVQIEGPAGTAMFFTDLQATSASAEDFWPAGFTIDSSVGIIFELGVRLRINNDGTMNLQWKRDGGSGTPQMLSGSLIERFLIAENLPT